MIRILTVLLLFSDFLCAQETLEPVGDYIQFVPVRKEVIGYPTSSDTLRFTNICLHRDLYDMIARVNDSITTIEFLIENNEERLQNLEDYKLYCGERKICEERFQMPLPNISFFCNIVIPNQYISLTCFWQ